MKLSLDTRDLSEVRTDALIVGRHSDEAKLTPAFRAVDEKLGGLLSKVLAAEKFEGKPGQVSHVHTDGRLRAARVLVAGLGPRKGSAADAVRSAASAAARRARDLGARSAAAYLAADGLSARARAQATVEGAQLGRIVSTDSEAPQPFRGPRHLRLFQIAVANRRQKAPDNLFIDRDPSLCRDVR